MKKNKTLLFYNLKRKNQYGFTLIEVIITLVITCVIVFMIYKTFYTSYKISSEIDNYLESTQTIFNFLQKFNLEVSGIIPEKEEFIGLSDNLQFLYKRSDFLYPVEVSYLIKNSSDGYKELWKYQKDLLSGYTFSFPVFSSANDIYFSFFDGSQWVEEWEKEELPFAIALNIKINGEDIFSPITILK